MSENGAPERSRTPNLLIRSQALYPIELRALKHASIKKMDCKYTTRYSKKQTLFV